MICFQSSHAFFNLAYLITSITTFDKYLLAHMSQLNYKSYLKRVMQHFLWALTPSKNNFKLSRSAPSVFLTIFCLEPNTIQSLDLHFQFWSVSSVVGSFSAAVFPPLLFHFWCISLSLQVILSAASVPLSLLLSTPLFLRTKLEVNLKLLKDTVSKDFQSQA